VDWNDLAKEFERIEEGLRADWTINDGNPRDADFAIKGGQGVDAALCEQYCRRGGKRLLGSVPIVFSYQSLTDEPDDLGRWIKALHTSLNAGVITGLTTIGQTNSYTSWEIKDVGSVSRLLCLKIINEQQ